MTVIVYSKPNCSLCEKAAVIIGRLRREFGYRTEYVDITTDPDLFSRYRNEIPVVTVDGREIARGIVSMPALREALRQSVEP
jgi:glutaredoxin